MTDRINGVAIAAIGAGSVFAWSGVKGWSVLATVGDVISGKKPAGTEINILAGNGAGNSAGGNSSGASTDALRYQGHDYAYGGAPGPNGSNPWDCSSFANWVFGHDLAMAIPGYGPGKYDGSAHGPPTGAWAIWPGLKHIQQSQLQAGDVIVWAGHMGIAISNTEMISALNSKLKTRITPIQGYGNGPLLCYGRLLWMDSE